MSTPGTFPDPSETGCAILIGDPAVSMVSAAYDKYTQYATQAYTLASTEIAALANVPLAPISFGVSWDFEGYVTAFQRPPAPAAAGDLDFHSPGTLPAPPTIELGTVSLDAAPDAPSNPVPTVQEFSVPAELAATAPTDDIILTPIPTPVRPDMTLPPVPTLADLNLPTAPDIVLTPFAGARPDTTLEAPVENFAFTPAQYVSDLLDRTRDRVSAMLDGGTGLPSAVAQALRDRAWDGVDTQEGRAIATATEEFGAKGFAEPNGILIDRLAAVRQNNQNQRNTMAREIYVKDEEIAIENLRFAVTEGVALESQLMQNHSEFMRLGLAAAQATQELAIRVFDAQVQLVNTQMQVYVADAQVWREQLQGELVKLQVYRAELEALQIQGTLNEQQVRIYSARIGAVNALADVYRADVSAATAVAEQNKAVIEGFSVRVQAYGAQVDAYKATWDGYRTKLESNNVRAQLYGLIEQGYSTRVGSWANVQRAKLAQQGNDIQVADLRLRGWHGGLEKLLADLEAEKTRIASVADAFRTNVALYSAQAGVETAASDANLRALNAGVARERQRTDVALANVKMSIDQMLGINQLAINRADGLARVSTQLAASSMSAVNFSAGVHSGRSESQSCGTSFEYSASLDDSSAV